MKNSIITLFIMGLFVSCTTYKDDLKIPKQDYKTITVESVNTDLKIVNIVVDQDAFDNMYSNYTENIEIEAYFNLYKNNELLIENEEIELEIKGSHSAQFALKSLGIKFESKYKNENNNFNLINPELLPFHSVEKIKSIRLRNSGNDFLGTMIKDMSYTKLAIEAGLNIDVMYAEQAVVFVNNTFLGIMNIRTEKNKHGLSKLYDVNKNDLTIAKIEHPGIFIKKDGDFNKIDNFVTAIEQRDFDYLINEIEPSNFIDYFIYESYIANWDWPKSNLMFFAIEDGPFRFFLYDMDHANTLHIDEAPSSFIYSEISNIGTDLFDVLYSNQEFKTQYDTRWNELISSGLLSSNNFNAIVNNYKSNIEKEMRIHLDKYNTFNTLTEWYISIDELKADFEERENYINN